MLRRSSAWNESSRGSHSTILSLRCIWRNAAPPASPTTLRELASSQLRPTRSLSPRTPLQRRNALSPVFDGALLVELLLALFDALLLQKFGELVPRG